MLIDRPDIAVENNLYGDVITMKLDENSLVHLMSVLTKLYSDHELACIREYSTNALDSHIEAGQTRPIEVNTPGSLSPYLSIRDYGVGLNRQDIQEIYSLYGASTKRETNTQVGSLGLGCKSALAYTSTFTVVGVKDGIRTVVAVTRNEDGIGQMTVVEEVETDEANGVEVRIPANSYNDFGVKAQQFFRFWRPGTVLLNGQEPEVIDGLKLSDNIILIKNARSYSRENWVVMGGVPYPAEMKPNISTEYGVVAFVDIGDVNFPPSRESLEYTKKTKARIEQIEKDVRDGLIAAATKDVEAAGNPIEAASRSRRWKEVIAVNKDEVQFNYRGVTIPDMFDAPANERFLVSPADSHKLSSHSRYPAVALGTLLDGVLVYGYNHDKFNATHKRKLKRFVDDKGIVNPNGPIHDFILSFHKITTPYIDATRIVNWDDVKKIKLPVGGTFSRNGSRPLGSYKVFLPRSSFVTDIMADQIDTSEKLFWTAVGGDPRREQFVREACPDATMVLLPTNRIAKFCRDFPMAERATDAFSTLLDAKIAELQMSEDEKKAWYLQNNRRYELAVLARLNASQVDDPDLKEGIRIANLKLTDEQNQLIKEISRFRSLSLVEYEWDNPLSKYPLLDLRYSEIHPHVYVYLNAAYYADNQLTTDEI